MCCACVHVCVWVCELICMCMCVCVRVHHCCSHHGLPQQLCNLRLRQDLHAPMKQQAPACFNQRYMLSSLEHKEHTIQSMQVCRCMYTVHVCARVCVCMCVYVSYKCVHSSRIRLGLQGPVNGSQQLVETDGLQLGTRLRSAPFGLRETRKAVGNWPDIAQLWLLSVANYSSVKMVWRWMGSVKTVRPHAQAVSLFCCILNGAGLCLWEARGRGRPLTANRICVHNLICKTGILIFANIFPFDENTFRSSVRNRHSVYFCCITFSSLLPPL